MKPFYPRSLALLMLAVPFAPALAQTAPVGVPQVYGLTDQQKAEVRDAQRDAWADAASGQLPGGGSDRQIHGEVGAMIGTGGARSIGGTAAIPLGQTGGAIVSFESMRFGDRPRGW